MAIFNRRAASHRSRWLGRVRNSVTFNWPKTAGVDPRHHVARAAAGTIRYNGGREDDLISVKASARHVHADLHLSWLPPSELARRDIIPSADMPEFGCFGGQTRAFWAAYHGVIS